MLLFFYINQLFIDYEWCTMKSKLLNFEFNNINIYDLSENISNKILNRMLLIADQSLQSYANSYLDEANNYQDANNKRSSIYYLLTDSEFAFYLRNLSLLNEDFLFVDSKLGLIEDFYDEYSLWDYLEYKELLEVFREASIPEVKDIIIDYIQFFYYSSEYNSKNKLNLPYKKFIESKLYSERRDLIFKKSKCKINIDFSDSYVWQILIERNDKNYDFTYNKLTYKVNIMSVDLLRKMIYTFMWLNCENIDLSFFLFFIQDSRFAIEFLNSNYILSDSEILNSRDLSEFFTMFSRNYSYYDAGLVNRPLSMHDCDEFVILMYYFYYLAYINQESNSRLMNILANLDTILMDKYVKKNDPVIIDIYSSTITEILSESNREFRYAARMSEPSDIDAIIQSDEDRINYYQSMQKSCEFMMKIIGVLDIDTAYYKIFDTVLSNTDLSQLRAYFSYNFILLTYRKEEKILNNSFFAYLLEEKREEAIIPRWKQYFYLRYLSENKGKLNLHSIVRNKDSVAAGKFKRINSNRYFKIKPQRQRYYINVYDGLEKLNINNKWNYLIKKYNIDCRDFCKLMRYKNFAMANEDPYYNLLFFKYDFIKSNLMMRNARNNRKVFNLPSIKLLKKEDKVKLIKLIGNQKQIATFITYPYVIVDKLDSLMGNEWILSVDDLSAWREVLVDTYQDHFNIQVQKKSIDEIKQKLELTFINNFKKLFENYNETFILSLNLETIIELIKLQNGIIDCDLKLDNSEIQKVLSSKLKIEEKIIKLIEIIKDDLKKDLS